MSVLPVSEDFRAEVDEVDAFLETLSEEDWARETGFQSWTPWDVLAHLHFFDLQSLLALEGEERFAPERARLMKGVAEGRSLAVQQREQLGALDAARLRAAWRSTAHALADGLGACDPKQRLPWFGPDMGAAMFTTARYMETWAHAQEIYDLRGVMRVYNDRIRNIATIGVKTFGWTFVNRGLEVPGPVPYVRLEAPSGAVWEWNDPSEVECVAGLASDFCHVVTQGRNVKDTALAVTGAVATRWMAIAQCFAGGAADPPAPGSRGPGR